jgi:hypothetical protein
LELKFRQLISKSCFGNEGASVVIPIIHFLPKYWLEDALNTTDPAADFTAESAAFLSL